MQEEHAYDWPEKRLQLRLESATDHHLRSALDRALEEVRFARMMMAPKAEDYEARAYGRLDEIEADLGELLDDLVAGRWTGRWRGIPARGGMTDSRHGRGGMPQRFRRDASALAPRTRERQLARR